MDRFYVVEITPTGGAGPDQPAPGLEVARDTGAERPEEPRIRLPCHHERQLSRQSDEKGMRAD
jgi:hypothetical protein